MRRVSVVLERRLARSTATAPERLLSLASVRDPVVRRAVAGNPSSPAEALTSCAQDGATSVRIAAATHPVTPPEVLDALLGDAHPNVRSAALSVALSKAHEAWGLTPANTAAFWYVRELHPRWWRLTPEHPLVRQAAMWHPDAHHSG